MGGMHLVDISMECMYPMKTSMGCMHPLDPLDSCCSNLGSSHFWNFLIGTERERRAHTHPIFSADGGPSPT